MRLDEDLDNRYTGKMLSEIAKSQKILIMLGIMSAMLLAALDQTIIATAMPRIVQELNGLGHLSWVFTAYLLASTVVVPIAGKISDIYGRKSFYIVSITIFLIGSVLSGLAQNMTQLIFFRAIQGLGGGAIMSNSFTIIGDLFPPSERGKWQGMLGAVFALSSVLGPLLGGYLTDNASWRWSFFINIPVGAIALGLVFFLMPNFSSAIKDKIMDYKGAIVLTVGLIALLLGLVWGGNQYPWNSIQILGMFIFAVISFLVFAKIESTVREPIIPLSLFRNPVFSTMIPIVFLTAIGMFSVIMYVPLFAQIVLGISATNSGTMLTPMMLGHVFSSVVSGQITSRSGKYKPLIILSLIVSLIAIFWLSTIDSSTTQQELIMGAGLMGIGLGISMPLFTLAVQNAFDYSKLGVATAATQLFRSIGSTVGVAIMGSFLNSSLSSKLSVLSSQSSNLKLSPGAINIDNLQNYLATAHNQQLSSVIKSILASSIGGIFLIGFFLLLIGLIVSFFLKEIPLRKSHRPVLEKAGVEIAVEEGDFSAKDEPDLS
jgi:EmrB/QacA subfamily drug resistance transporter